MAVQFLFMAMDDSEDDISDELIKLHEENRQKLSKEKLKERLNIVGKEVSKLEPWIVDGRLIVIFMYSDKKYKLQCSHDWIEQICDYYEMYPIEIQEAIKKDKLKNECRCVIF